MKVQLCIVVIVVVLQQEIVHSFKHNNYDRRGPPMHLMNRCCNNTDPGQTEFHEKIETLKEECKQELGKTEFLCVTECLAEKLGVINNDTTLNEDGFRTFVENDLAREDYQKAVVDQAVEKCAAKPRTLEKRDGCSDIGIELYLCVSKEFFIACPDDLQDPSEHCQKLREFVKETH